MKKWLFAFGLAIFANVSMGQVSITGALVMGYKATTAGNVAATQSSGFGVDSSTINFVSQEDLGGGQKLIARLGIQGADRSGANDASTGNGNVLGGDSFLAYSHNGFGRIEIGTARAAADMVGVPSAGAPVVDMDEKIYGARFNRDYLSYSVPIGPVITQIRYVEPKLTGVGLGLGSTASAGQHDVSISALYFQGPVKLIGSYASFDNRNTLPVGGTKDNAYLVQGSYDFGVANIGAGYTFVNATNGAHVMFAMVGINVPMGAWNVGAAFGQSNLYDAPVTSTNLGLGPWDISKYNGNASSFSFGANYALSKRTNITGKYASWTPSGFRQFEADAGANGRSGLSFSSVGNEFSLLLSHTF